MDKQQPEAKKKILVVEDEKALIDVMCLKLKADGCEAIRAQTGTEGLKKAKSEKPDAILLDIIMPEMDGYEVLRRLKADPDTKDIPVIILSNSGRDEEVEKGKDLGAVDYLIKSQLSLDEMAQKAKKLAGAK